MKKISLNEKIIQAKDLQVFTLFRFKNQRKFRCAAKIYNLDSPCIPTKDYGKLLICLHDCSQLIVEPTCEIYVRL
jgi:hypothetical protein